VLAVARESRFIETNKREERVNGTEPAVATTDAVPAIVLQMLEEGSHQLGIQILDLQITGLASVMLGGKSEKESEGISIAGDCVGAGAQLSQQPVGEEPL
jgi:hypothetical protein